MDPIRDFGEQLKFKPEIQNREKLQRKTHFIVAGMGGSHLSADILKYLSGVSLFIHSDYGLPKLSPSIINDSLIIVSSYSGNTEEALDTFHLALSKSLPVAVITKGGQLLEEAKSKNIPYIQLPDFGFQPRMSVGLSLVALSHLILDDQLDRYFKLAGEKIDINHLEAQAREIAKDIKDKIPVVYSSRKNKCFAQNWKINFNENVKIPSFWNVFPELNHNEMTGFDLNEKTKNISGSIHVIILSDDEDDPRINKRIAVTKQLLLDRNISVSTVNLRGGKLDKVLHSFILSQLSSFHLAELYGVDFEPVPMVEEFKKLIK